MKLILMLALAPILALAATREPDFTAAKKAAETANADIVVLFHGSDWCQPGKPFAALWNQDAFAHTAGNVVLVAIDRKETQTEEDKALAEKNKACSPGIRSLPALAYYDSKGRLIGTRSGLPELGNPQALSEILRKFTAMRTLRDQQWAKAEKLQGTQKAEALGAGLDAMNVGLGEKKVFEPILKEIQKADPDDRSGYYGKYTFPGLDYAPQILDKYVKEKKFDEGEAELAKWSRNTRLNVTQRQQLMAARFALYQNWPEKKDQAKVALKAMRDADPKSMLGMAAANYLAEYDKEKK